MHYLTIWPPFIQAGLHVLWIVCRHCVCFKYQWDTSCDSLGLHMVAQHTSIRHQVMSELAPHNVSLAIGAKTASNIPVEMCCVADLNISLFGCMLIRFCWACGDECVYEEGELVDILAFLPAAEDRILVVNGDLFLDVLQLFFFFFPSRFPGSEFQRHSRSFTL